MTRTARLRLALASALPVAFLLAISPNLSAQNTQTGAAPQQWELNPASTGTPQRPVNEATLRHRKTLQPTVTEHEGIEVFHIDANGQPIRPAGSESGREADKPAGGSNLTIELKMDNLPGFKNQPTQQAQPAENPQWKAAFNPPAQTTNGIAIPKEYQQAPAPAADQPATDYSQGVPLIDPTAPQAVEQPASQELKIDSQELYQQLNQAAQPQTTPSRTDASARPATENGPRFSFENDSYNFGDIKEGQVVNYEIKFRNSGTAPLKLTSVKASCGCTAADWPRNEIKPGEQGTIHVKFNSAGRLGPQHKTITVITNEAEGKPYQFHLKGEVFKGTPPAR